MSTEEKFEVLKGMTIVAISGAKKGEDKICIETSDGCKYIMYHDQCCCESVLIEDICGDINDIIGSEILLAEEVRSREDPKVDADSYTWTFYKLSTIKGSVTIRWYGSSNGYYSESVTFEKVSE